MQSRLRLTGRVVHKWLSSIGFSTYGAPSFRILIYLLDPSECSHLYQTVGVLLHLSEVYCQNVLFISTVTSGSAL